MAFEKGNKYGNRFSSSNQPKKRGGKTNVFAQLRKEVEKDLGCKISEIDINNICAMALFGNAEMHQAYLTGEDGKTPNQATPMVLMNLIRAIQIQTKTGRTDAIEKIIERLYGKVTQPIEGEINAQVTNTVDLSVLTTDELIQYNALLEKIKAGSNGKG